MICQSAQLGAPFRSEECVVVERGKMHRRLPSKFQKPDNNRGLRGNVSFAVFRTHFELLMDLAAHPHLAPTPPSVEPTLLVPDRGSPGLFGPRSPRDSYRG